MNDTWKKHNYLNQSADGSTELVRTAIIDRRSGEEIVADVDDQQADLIVAAPELLLALREARKWVEANVAQVRGLSAEASEPGEAMLRQIDVAIAKAGGAS